MYTTHGYKIEGTANDGTQIVMKARCGGPGLCKTCSVQALYYTDKLIPTSKTGTYVELTTFVRKPFTVEAVEITEENIAELAEFIGTLRTKDDGTPYIQVARRLVPNIFRVYPGFWMTKMGDNVRCYSRRIFTEQFTETTPEIESWVSFLNGEDSPEEIEVDATS